ncbi:hypothetical protein, conserved [Eimeria acervulina]|uniref:Uncharacterized protein n=1 Tax=Eimeria acervulina TaxID=5801 RepID=U6GMP1_EIMAC|nr:hypothetical protein, conserved [Eimeria acervulina]CDI81455.1 hypothetical protein, conserved [Eimeria acervulina]
MISVLLAWAQEPLLSFFVSAAAARLKEGASLAVSAAGAGSQLPDGLCLLLAALGVAMTSICSSSKHAAAPAAAAAADAEEEDEEAAAAPTIATVKQQQQQQQQQQTFTAPLCPFRSAAVGVWLASVLGLGLTICLYFGAEDILSFFLSIKTAAAAAGGLQQQQQQQDTLSLAFNEHAEQQQQQPQQQQQKLLRGLRFFSVLYRAPSAAEVSLFGPFLMPILTQCCVRSLAVPLFLRHCAHLCS